MAFSVENLKPFLNRPVIQKAWTLTLRFLLWFCTYGVVMYGIGLFRCSGKAGGLAFLIMCWADWLVLKGLRKDQKRVFPPEGVIERRCIYGGIAWGLIVGLTGDICS